MKSILYIGNKLSHHGFTKGVIETLGPQLETEGFTVYYAGTRKNLISRLVEMLWSVIKYRGHVKYVLIDTYSTSAFWYAWLSGILANAFKIRYIPILHGGNMPARLKRSKKASNILFKNSYANVAVSGYLKKAFDEAGYKAIVIPNNIDITNYTFKFRVTPSPKLLWVRSFHRQYNPNMAADVLSNLLITHPDAELCMVGPDKDGSMATFKDYALTKGILDKINIIGVLSKEAWATLASDYDFFINTTNVDNTPVSVIEAMALGLCIVSTNPGGIPFLLSDNENACLVELNDSVQMSKIITGLLENPDIYKQLVHNGREKVNNFDWNVIKNQWLNLLSE